jgi:hypothetical protein
VPRGGKKKRKKREKGLKGAKGVGFLLSPLLPFRGGCRRSAAIRILERVFSVPPFNYRLSAASRLTIGSLTGWGLAATLLLFSVAFATITSCHFGFFVRCPMLSSGSFSLVSSRAFVVPSSPSLRLPLSAPWFRAVVGHALASGASRWRLRRSVRSFSGAVVVVGFADPVAASTFAAAFSGWCGVALAVRRFGAALWGVSVPVAAPPRARSLSLPVPPLPASAAWVSG